MYNIEIFRRQGGTFVPDKEIKELFEKDSSDAARKLIEESHRLCLQLIRCFPSEYMTLFVYLYHKGKEGSQIMSKSYLQHS